MCKAIASDRVISAMGVQVKVVLRADVSGGTYDKVAIISGTFLCLSTYLAMLFTVKLDSSYD